MVDQAAFMASILATPAFSPDEQVRVICGTAMSTPKMSGVSGYFDLSSSRPCNLGGVDLTDALQDLAASSFAAAVAAGNDARNFHKLANRDVALDIPKLKTEDIITALMTDHINLHLSQNGLPSLNTLRANQSFVADFKAHVNSVTFDPSYGRENNHAAMTVLFTYEFFEHGPGFKLATDPTQLACHDVIKTSLANSLSKLSNPSKDDLTYLAGHVSFSIGCLLSASGRADIGLNAYALKLSQAGMLFSPASQPADIAAKLNDIIAEVNNRSVFNDANFSGLATISHQFWNKWTEALCDPSATNFWVAGVRNVEAATTVEDWDHYTSGGPWPFKVVTVETTYGVPLTDWISDNSTLGYLVSGVEVHNVERVDKIVPSCLAIPSSESTPPSHVRTDSAVQSIEKPILPKKSAVIINSNSGFLAGTPVLTENGCSFINDIEADDMILTSSGSFQTTAMQSDSPQEVFGFNGEAPFFARAQIFHTTTGLRALDPDLARQENPWIDVGTLAIGHQLLHTIDGADYTPVLVQSIDRHKSNSSCTFAVHFDSDACDYIANGFKVATTYPEFSTSSLAAELNNIPVKDRIALLARFPEVMRIISRVGSQPVLEALEREAQCSAISYGGARVTRRPFSVREMTMSYMIVGQQDITFERLELYHGVLHIDGALCRDAEFGADTVTWSRQLKGGRFEHATCQFIDRGMRARGRIAQTKSMVPDDEELEQNLERFALVAGVLRKQPETNPQAGLALVEVASVLEPLRFDFIYDPNPFDPTKPLDTWKPSAQLGSTSLVVDGDAVDWTKWTFDQYQAIWKQIVARAQAEAPNDKAKSAVGDLDSLLDVCPDTDATSALIFTVICKQSDLILQASDQYQTWIKNTPDWKLKQDQVPTRNLTFTNLGMAADFKLAMLVQSMRVRLGPFNDTAEGVVAEYSPLGDANNGTVHWITGKISQNTTSTLSSIMTRIPTNPVHNALTLHNKPSNAAYRLAVFESDLDLAKKIAALPYSQQSINTSVQTTMFNVMAWHMDDKDRETFVGAKPTNLDRQFTEDIKDGPVGQWLKNTYATAWLCQVLSNQSSGLRKRCQFTADEQKSIQYFWSGKGSKCLAQSTEYKTLERLINRYEIRKAFPAIQNAYDNKKGSAISNLIYDKSTTTLGLQSFGSTYTESGTSHLTKIAAFLDALDDGTKIQRDRKITTDVSGTEKTIQVTDTNSNHLQLRVMAFQKYKCWFNPYLGDPNITDDEAAAELQQQWLTDCMTDVVAKLLTHSSDQGGSILKEMADEINAWGTKHFTNWDKMKPEDRILNVVSGIGVRLRPFLQAMSRLSGWVKVGGKWVASTIATASWSERFERLRSVAGWVAEESIVDPHAKVPLTVPLMKGLLFTLGAVVLGAQIWLLKDSWHEASPAKRGALIIGVLASFRQLADLGLDLAEAIMKYGGNSALGPNFQRALAAQWNELYETFGTEISYADWDETRQEFMWKVDLGAETEFASNLEKQNIKPLESEWAWFEETEGANGSAFEVALAEAESGTAKVLRLRRVFAVARFALQVIGYVLAIAVAVFMTWQLITEWDKLDNAMRAFQTIQVVLALVEAIGAAGLLVLGATAAIATVVSTGWGIGSAFAASTTAAFFAAASIFASVCLILAIVAVLVMVAMFIYLFNKEPDLNPAEEFVTQRGKPFAQLKDYKPPNAPCQFAVNPSGDPTLIISSETTVQLLEMSFTNTTSSEQTMDFLDIAFATGKDKVEAVFNDGIDFVSSTDGKAGCVAIKSSIGSRADLDFIASNHDSILGSYKTVKFTVRGLLAKDMKTTTFTMAAGETITFMAYGTICLKADKMIACSVTGTQSVKLDTMTTDCAIKPTADVIDVELEVVQHQQSSQ